MQPLILADQITRGAADFLRAAFPSSTPGFDGLLERFLARPGNLFKGPYLTLPLPFRTQADLGKPFFSWLPDGFRPYAHQARAFKRLSGDYAASTLVATGTGSGKTECFLYPILEHCRQQRQAGHKGIKAIILYPMNALATDQASRLAKLILSNTQLSGIRAGLYVGGDAKADPADGSTASGKVQQLKNGGYSLITDRAVLRNDPPDILLTNYKMLDFLLIRVEDSPLWAHQQPDTLRYLVVDELHTFDGAQGTDLACLIRRLKGRLQTPPGQLVCVGTSATLGSEGEEGLLAFAGQIFGERFQSSGSSSGSSTEGNGAIITEDRLSVAEYLQNLVVEYTQTPQQEDEAILDPSSDAAGTPKEWLAAQVPLWFGETHRCKTPNEVEDPLWRCKLADLLRGHFAFHNLLKDLERLASRSVPVEQVLQTLTSRLPAGSSFRFASLWLGSLLALVAHARTARGGIPARQVAGPESASQSVAGTGKAIETNFFLQVKVEIWLRELRRMVASLDSASPELKHHDDIHGKQDDRLWAPVLSCRDCHTTGWGATISHADENVLITDPQTFYNAYFGESLSTRMIFPLSVLQAGKFDAGILRQFSVRKLCPSCGTLHHKDATTCGCMEGASTMLEVLVTNNMKQRQHKGAKQTYSSHDCPFCDGDNTLSILGSQAASLSAVMLAQLFGSSFNADKKLIAFSDSVQDAAHRAGFLQARTWRLNLRPALAQVINEGDEHGQPLTMEALPAHFERHWQKELGEALYLSNFLPTSLHWLRDFEHLQEHGELPAGSELPKWFSALLPWLLNAEFGREAGIGRSLVATGTAAVHLPAEALDKAVKYMSSILPEKLEELSEATPEEMSVFLQGMVESFQRVGAWKAPGLDLYMEAGCQPWRYKGRPLAMSHLSSGLRAPRFISLVKYGRCISMLGTEQQWYRAWAFKAFPGLHAFALPSDKLLPELYQVGVDALQHAGIADCVADSKEQNIHVWGLMPGAFQVVPQVSQWCCDTCHRVVWRGDAMGVKGERSGYGSLEGQPCRDRVCSGRLKPASSDAGVDSQGYYRRLYLSADIRRVVAKEHTSLLERPVREEVERRFKANHHPVRPGDVNVLSATPTLEMGIDIGDLSAVLQCSVPPRQASYIQRAGRAGRSTGNALVMTMANATPHDLYFWHDPRTMIAGAVDAPGVFLNASAVLERQLTAYTLDCWVQDALRAGARAKGTSIPKTLGEVLKHVGKADETAFPYTWLKYVEANQEALLAGFLELFRSEESSGSSRNRLDAELTPESTQWLRSFIQGGEDREGVAPSLAFRILNRLNEVDKDRAELKKRQERIGKETAKRQSEVQSDSVKEDLARLRQERRAIGALLARIDGKQTLNFMTDEGLLPNYAFPEEGVVLRSVITRADRSVSHSLQSSGASASESSSHEAALQTFEYERAASVAIRELAPNNTFYAEGRRVVVNQVEISQAKPEPWRFCRQCGHAEQGGTTTGLKQCPRCGDGMWADSGRVRRMARLTTVYARTPDSESRIGDDSDERKRAFYVDKMLVDVAPEDVSDAYMVKSPGFPFGFEFLRKVTLRQVNFGESGDAAQDAMMTIAGEERPRPGFQLCETCGTLQKTRNVEIAYLNHAPWCSARHQAPSGLFGSPSSSEEGIFLYREFASEGIRFFLPEVGFSDVPEAMHSFMSALELGLMRRFHGAVSHLRIATDVRMASNSQSAQTYLVIYDTVPGGTGYLKELMRDRTPVLEVLEGALQVLRNCACKDDEGADGCYRCVYRYNNNRDRALISRRLALQLLEEVLGHKDQLVKVHSLAARQQDNPLLESSLEKRFLEALRRPWPSGQFQLKDAMFNGKHGYWVHAGKRRWRLELQVMLDNSQGVAIPCKPDFVFWPDDGVDDLPIAVFTDGWQYHKDRVLDDLAKRQAIAHSGKFSVWTLTWSDVSAAVQYDQVNPISGSGANVAVAGNSAPGGHPPWRSLLSGNAVAAFEKLLQSNRIQALNAFHQQPAFLQLHARLAGHTHRQMERLAGALAISLLAPLSDAAAAQAEKEGRQAMREGAFWQQLKGYGLLELEDEPASRWGYRSIGSDIQFMAGMSNDALKHWMGGDPARQHDPALVVQWNPVVDSSAGLPDNKQTAWHQLWQVLNLLLPLRSAWVGQEGMADLARLVGGASAASVDRPFSQIWEPIMDLAAAEVQPWLQQLARQGVSLPKVGYELMGSDERVLAEAELAWPDRKVAVLMPSDEDGVDNPDRERMVGMGWTVFVVSTESALDELLAILKND